jgi:hypothetical protein
VRRWRSGSGEWEGGFRRGDRYRPCFLFFFPGFTWLVLLSERRLCVSYCASVLPHKQSWMEDFVFICANFVALWCIYKLKSMLLHKLKKKNPSVHTVRKLRAPLIQRNSVL